MGKRARKGTAPLTTSAGGHTASGHNVARRPGPQLRNPRWTTRLKDSERQLRKAISTTGTGLLNLYGIGPVTAA
jgi:hypothetical protein